jgi:predicted nucleotide-binding protein
MDKDEFTGLWTGTIEGTNTGGFTLDLQQDGQKLHGLARFSEPAYGQYEYLVEGSVDSGVILNLTPGRRFNPVLLGEVKVIGKLINGVLSGQWASNIGTAGVFTARKFENAELEKELPSKNSVFIVHGHDEGAKHSVARFLEQIGVNPVILHEQINKGMTIVEKFEKYAKRAGYAVIIMSPDDFGYQVGNEKAIKNRARQNVILELGYFTALLGREKTMVLKKGDIEMPSDVFGILYESIENDGWKMALAKELKDAGFTVDLNKAI